MADDYRNSPTIRRLARAALAFDAWVNSSVYDLGQAGRRVYSGFQMFMERFHVAGWRRGAVELACEGLTLGLGASIVALTLAAPAFRETSEDWLKKQELAVTFLDRNGQEVGRRGIRHDDSVPLDQVPERLRGLLQQAMKEFKGRTLIAINVGGALIPVVFSFYLIQHHPLPLDQVLIATALVAAVCHAFSRPVAGIGIGIPIFIAPLTAAIVALLINSE